ncbi:transport-associated protein [Caballeronia terrestris]|jgi:hyperosmotically inducible protein|uniref:Transport-associated protein n=1 Tax=Caballeronia terrestris TaxID=1226301 RepID=A0A158JUS5_9BURK|nr:BON domain-containing protein [Caballeronia terrestris]SAL72040.1 transport-associated protein [Caballeronia terrestris]
MNALKPLKLAAGVLVVAVSMNAGILSAYAQSSDAAPATSAAPSAKSSKAANRALAKDVRKSLTKTKGLSSSNITVRANGGAVTLAGTVPDAAQIDKAGEAAKGTAGVTSVKNALTIRAIGQ